MSLFMQNNSRTVAGPLAAKMSELLMDAWGPASPVVAPPFAPANVLIPVPDAANPIWGDGVALPVAPAGSHDVSPAVSPMKELVDIYRRLRDTMIMNDLPARPYVPENSQNDLYGSDTLARALGTSISSVEIQQRGVEAQPGMTLLDTVPQQAITHLRVLSETALSFVSIGGIKYAGDNWVAKEFCRAYERQYYQLFMREPYVTEMWQGHNSQIAPLLDQDIFVFLTECTLCLEQVDEEIDVMHLVRLCYLAELVKVVLKMGRLMDAQIWGRAISAAVNSGTDDFADFTAFCDGIWTRERFNSRTTRDKRMATVYHHGVGQARAFVQTYATVFLRKVVVLMHVRYGVAFNNYISANPVASELTRLAETLRLPSLDEMFSMVQGDENILTVQTLTELWIKHSHGYFHVDSGETLSLTHPSIFELIGLPKNYDTLLEETMKRRCPTTGKDVSDPMLCLFCGDIFCGQSICCLKEGPERRGRRAHQIGGAQQHMLKYAFYPFTPITTNY